MIWIPSLMPSSALSFLVSCSLQESGVGGADGDLSKCAIATDTPPASALSGTRTQRSFGPFPAIMGEDRPAPGTSRDYFRLMLIQLLST